MKNWKTTLAGAICATLVAVKPILDGSGYHFDKKTVAELAFAGALAFFGFVLQDAKNDK